MDQNKNIHTDFLVIGAGSAGLTVVSGLDKLGKNYLLVSKNIGGDCTNFGCVPSKKFLDLAKKYKQGGLTDQVDNVFSEIQQIIDQIKHEDSSLFSEDNFILGSVEFVNKDSVLVTKENGKNVQVSFRKAVIATGSSPRLMRIPGVSKDRIHTNQTIFTLKKMPESITIIGAGPVGVEMSTAFASFGVKVNLVVRSVILKSEPVENRQLLKSQLEEQGVNIYEGTKLVEEKAGELEIETRKSTKIETQKIPATEIYLSAIGRVPNTKLKLDNAGIKSNEKGIIVNNNLITNNRRVFAIGDVVNESKFTHLANSHGRFVIQKILLPFSNRPKEIIPRVTFTNPEIASVGKLEEDDLVKKHELNLSGSDRAVIVGQEKLKGLVYIHMLTGRIKGASIYGDGSEHLINFFTLAIKQKISIFRQLNFIPPYPTYFSSYPSFLTVVLLSYQKNFSKNLRVLLRINLERIFAIIFWIIAGSAIAIYLASINFEIMELIRVLDSALSSPAGIFLYILMYTLRPLLFLSAAALSILAPYQFGFLFGTLLIIVASNLSSAFAYFLGRTVFANRAETSEENTNSGILANIKENTFESVLLARLAYLPYDFVSYVAGGLNVKFIPFITATALGSLPGTIAFASFGASLQNIQDFENFSLDYRYLILGLVIFILSLGISRIVKRSKNKY